MRRICAASVIAAASSSPSHAQIAGAFESARWIPLPGSASESVAADLDGDGDQDVVVALSGANRIAVLRNSGDGRLTPLRSLDGAIYPHHVAIADFDGDGAPDLFSLDEDPTAARIHLNHGDATFAPSVGYAAGYHPWSAAVADYDGDGRPDVALATRSAYGAPDELRVLWNDGTGALASSSVVPGVTGAFDMRSLDFDGDGDVDIAVLGSGRLDVLGNRGDGTFDLLTSVVVGGPFSQIRLDALDDLDGDGDVDALFVRYEGNQTSAALVALDAGGTFLSPSVVTTFPIASSTTVLDADGDGRLDLLVHDPVADQLKLHRGRGDATFEAPRRYALTASFESLTPVDLDGDGDEDVVGATAGGLVTVLNRGGGRFDAEQGAPGWNAEAVLGADLDGDGDIDLVTRGAAMWIHENLGSGVFGSGAYLPSSNHSDARLADIDGDGDVDIVRVWEFGQGLTISPNRGDGTFADPVTTSIAGSPRRLATGDVDSDGDVDAVLALENPWWDPIPYEALVLLNRGDGTFERGDHFETDQAGEMLELVDFDGDGDLDLALATPVVAPYWVRNDGTGRFDEGHAQTFPIDVRYFVDLDADRRVDLLGSAWPDVLLYARNRGDGTFEPTRTLSIGASIAADSLVGFDIDEDGDVDLTNGLDVLENLGGEDFALVDRLHGGNLGRPFAGDIDGDGDIDVVLQGGVRVIRNGASAGSAAALGDGSGTPCPCGNVGAIGRGCANSVDPNGAELHANGNARLASDTLVLHASGATHGTALWLQGTQSANGGLGAPFGDGLLGVAGSIRRLATTTTSAGGASFPTGNARPLSALGGVGAAGTRTYQLLYRDAASHCTPFAFNLTNAVVVTWIP